jgi:predicted Zn-dependent peptidase
MKKLTCTFVLLGLSVFSFYVCADYDFSKVKDNVSEFTLANGLKFILYEDHSVPIATFVIMVNAGGSDERIGIWGISHFLEHMAFKGTEEVGTTDIKAERKIMAEMDVLFDRILAEKEKPDPDNEKVKKLEAELEGLKEKHAAYVVANEFVDIIKKNGAVGMNAGTSKDATMYLFSLPSNRIELWAYLESSRFADPVFRELYKERGVIQEERRMRTENNPFGKLVEELLALAFKDHPYHVNGIGPMSNIDHITRADMYRYFRANYTAKNMVIGVAGDVYPDRLKKLAKKYFSKLRPGRRNPGVFTDEPAQLGEKTITVYEESQPAMIMAYHCPSERHEDYIKFSVLNKVLTSGRSSRLNKRMVIEEKSALGIMSMAGYPGTKYPSLYVIMALPNSGHSVTELIDVIDSEIEKIKNESITGEELESAKTRTKVDLLKGMNSRMGLLMNMLSAELKLGSWENVFERIGAVDKVTAADIRELVKKYFIRSNRSIARIEKKEEEEVKK